MEQLIIKTKNVTFKEIPGVMDPEPNIRLYCVQHQTSYNLQIRGRLPLETNKFRSTQTRALRNLIATITLGKEDVLSLAKAVNEQPDLAFVKKAQAGQAGGGIMNDLLLLDDGRYLVVTKEIIALYKNPQQYEDNDYPIAIMDREGKPTGITLEPNPLTPEENEKIISEFIIKPESHEPESQAAGR